MPWRSFHWRVQHSWTLQSLIQMQTLLQHIIRLMQRYASFQSASSCLVLFYYYMDVNKYFFNNINIYKRYFIFLIISHILHVFLVYCCMLKIVKKKKKKKKFIKYLSFFALKIKKKQWKIKKKKKELCKRNKKSK